MSSEQSRSAALVPLRIEAEFGDRLDMLEDSDQITPLARRLCGFVLAEVSDQLDVEFTEGNAAPLVTHLAIALTRLNRGEAGIEASEVVEEEIRGRDRERAVVQRAMAECGRVLDRTIPDAEVSYMTVHLISIMDEE
jgi:transcriptional regulatory protein LevR